MELQKCPVCWISFAEPKKFCTKCGYSFETATPRMSREDHWNKLKPLIPLYLMVLLASLAGNLLNKYAPETSLGVDIGTDLFLILLTLYSVSTLKMSKQIRFKLSRFFIKPFKFSQLVLLGFGAIFASQSYFFLLTQIGFQSIATFDPSDPAGNTPFAIGVSFVSYLLVAPVLEEIFFRGVFFRRLRGYIGCNQAIILQGILFGVAHLIPTSFISHSLFGILLGWLRFKTGSLLPGILLHFCWNLIVILPDYFALF